LSFFKKSLLANYVLAEKDPFWGTAGAGGVFYAESTGRLNLQHRGPNVNEPNTWGTWGGRLEPGEDPEEALRREVQEESGYHGTLRLIPLNVFKEKDFSYHNYLIVIPKEFDPIHSWETQGDVWCKLATLPSPLHFGFRDLVPYITRVIEKEL